LKQILVLGEGQTEERFVKDVLQPHLWGFGIHIEPKILVTKRVKSGPDFKGGISSYAQVKADSRLLLSATHTSLVTTLFDLYGLPTDMPDYAPALGVAGAARAKVLERAMSADLGNPRRFHAFFMVHEYEAVLYCDPRGTAEALARPEHEATLAAERDAAGSPEDINDGRLTHPSQRILKLFPNYRRRLYGPQIASNIGLSTIRAQCPHFADWLSALERV